MAKNALFPLLGLAGIAAITLHQLDSKPKTVTMPFANLSDKSATQLRIEELEAALAKTLEENEDLSEPEKYLPEEKWLPNPQPGDSCQFREILNNDPCVEYNPLIPNQSFYGGIGSWENAGSTRFLEDDDCMACWMGCCDTSGYLKLRIAPNYRATFNIKTENYNYFHDAVTDSDGQTLADYVSSKGKEESNEWKLLSSNNSQVTVTLYGQNNYGDSPDGDYLSIDIDSEKSGVAEFAIRAQGVQFDTDENPDDEVWVQLVSVDYINPDYDESLLRAEDSLTFNANKITVWQRVVQFGGRVGTALKGIVKPAVGVSDEGVALTRLEGTVSVGAELAGTAKVTKVGGIVDKAGDVGGLTSSSMKAGEAFVGGTSGVKQVSGGVEVTLKNGWAIVKKSDGLVQTGKVLISKGDTLIKYSGKLDAVPQGVGIFGRLADMGIIRTGKGLFVGTMFLSAGALAWVIVNVASTLPDTLRDAGNDFACSITGSCCETECEDAEDSEGCVKECKEMAQEKAVKVGAIMVAGLLGLVLILKKGKSSKEAEGYYRIVDV